MSRHHQSLFLFTKKRLQRIQSKSRVESLRQKIHKIYYNSISLDVISAINSSESMQSICAGHEIQPVVSSNWIKCEFVPSANFLKIYVLKMVYIFLSGKKLQACAHPTFL